MLTQSGDCLQNILGLSIIYQSKVHSKGEKSGDFNNKSMNSVDVKQRIIQ